MSLADIGGGDNNMTSESIKKCLRNEKKWQRYKIRRKKNVVWTQTINKLTYE